jgi:nuclear transport factor 2 (NTF2) superfamily protein
MARPGMEWQEGKSTTNDSEFDLLKEVINSPRSPTNSRQVNNHTYRASQEPWVEENDPEYLTVKCVDNNKRPLVQNHVVYDNTVKRRRTDNFGGQTISPNSPSLMYNQDTMKHFATYPPTGPFILSPVNYLQNQGHFFQPGLSPQQHHHQQQNNSNASSIINPNLKLRTDGKVKDPGIKWTPEQDEQLKKAVEKYKESNWKSIAKMVDGRNHVQCLQRWKKVLQPGLIKGMWSEEEDNLLLRLMRQYNGDKCWTKIAESIPGRTAKQCRERFYLNLDPTINREPWTRQEDELLVDLHRRLGNKWAEIKRNLPGRTENGVKSRFKSIQRALKKQQAMKK